MATIAEQPPKKPRFSANRVRDPFGGGIPLALLAIAVTLIGFWRTFFTQLPQTDTLIQLRLALLWQNVIS